MEKPDNLAYLASVFEFCGSWHPALRPDRFWYFEELKGPLASRRRVDRPRLRFGALGFDYQPVIFRYTYTCAGA
jgi:hypothetical protein